MATLPVPGGDLNVWGTKLNTWLLVAHNPDGTEIGGSQTVQVAANVPISSAQLLDIINTPVEIVPSPGPGKFLSALSATIVYHAGATPYGVAGGGHLGLIYGNDVTNLTPPLDGQLPGDIVDGQGFIDQAADRVVVVTGAVNWASPAPIDPIRVEDLGWFLGTAFLTPTDGDGTLDVTVHYLIADLT